MREYGIGQSVPRTEDLRLLRGRGRYVDDLRFPNETRVYVVRSAHAAARLRGIDTSAARAAPGVLAVLTGADAVADGLGTFQSRMKLKRRDGRPNFEPPYRVLAHEYARHVGEGVAAIVAETLAQAKDAAELLEIDYEPLPSVTATAAAAAPGAAAVWPEQPDNLCFVHELGKREAVEQAFARAAHVAKLDLRITQLTTNSMEPRCAVGVWDECDERYTLYGSIQGVCDALRPLGIRHIDMPASPPNVSNVWRAIKEARA